MLKHGLAGALCLAAIGFAGQVASASDYSVSVGYADGLRFAGFFPNPWFGDPGVVFVGTTPAQGAPDAGAVRIDNTSGHAITISDVTVTIRPGISFDLWGSNSLLAGQMLILTQTGFYNFDTSDFPSSPNGVVGGDIPVVAVTENGGTPANFNDTGRVLNTNGYDFAYNGGNESFQWRTIGGNGTPGGGNVPEPGALAMLGGLALSGVTFLRRKRTR
jgi:hypothetical protein